MSDTLIDITRLLGRFLKGKLPTGIDRVGMAYIKHFGSYARAVVRVGGHTAVFSQAASARIFKQILHYPSSPAKRIVGSLIKDAYRIESSRKLAGSFLFNTGHSGMEVGQYSARLQQRKIRLLTMVHDLIPISNPEYCRAGEQKKHAARIENALRFSSGIIANSQETLNHLTFFAVNAGLSIPPATVAPLAPANFPKPSDYRPISTPYFVTLGTIEPRKNHWMILQLWKEMIKHLGEQTPKLVIIGQRGWECENVIDLLDRCELLRGFVTEIPSCSDTDLATYLYHSQALLFPTFIEGYGLPLVEALSLNVPVIASDIPIFKEIASNTPDYISPCNGNEWANLIKAYTKQNSPARSAQMERIAQFKTPTWATHFSAVENLLERLN